MKDPRGEAERWLEQARRDLEAAETIFAQGLWWVVCFQSQQAAEKAVKSFLYGAGERMVLGHSVAELVRRAEEHEPSFSDLRTSASALDRFYIPTRYPNGLPGGIPAESFAEQDARQAIDMAQAVLEFVERA
jgi:HEPN domain-containing protein